MSIPLAGAKMMPFIKQGAGMLARNAGKLGKELIPKGTPMERALMTAVWWGPDVLVFPALMAATAPEGTSVMDRLGIAGEEATIGTLASLAGQSAGIGLGKKLLKLPSGGQALGLLQTAGDFTVGAPARMLAPRPLTNKAYETAQLEGEELLRAQIRQEERERSDALLKIVLEGAGLSPNLMDNYG